MSVDEADNDPKVLLTYVAEALDAVEPVGERVFDALSSRSSSVPGSVVPRLGNRVRSCTTPVTLVLDDVHLTAERRGAGMRCRCWPITCRPGRGWCSAGRDEPPLRIARLRAEGRILEIGPGDLSLNREEPATALRPMPASRWRG